VDYHYQQVEYMNGDKSCNFCHHDCVCKSVLHHQTNPNLPPFPLHNPRTVYQIDCYCHHWQWHCCYYFAWVCYAGVVIVCYFHCCSCQWHPSTIWDAFLLPKCWIESTDSSKPLVPLDQHRFPMSVRYTRWHQTNLLSTCKQSNKTIPSVVLITFPSFIPWKNVVH